MRARDNPFRTERVLAVRYRFLDGNSMEDLIQRLQTLSDRAAIVGPEGAGKTTLHEDLATQLESRGRTVRWLRLNREKRPTASRHIRMLFDAARADELIFVDGAEQLGPLQWRSFRRRTDSYAGLVINTHQPGRLPTLSICRTSVDLLQTIVRQLLPDGDGQRPTPNELSALFRQHNGNLRLCLRSLYDQWSLRND